MALYGQLSDELEQTNRGVVALYAELEEKSEQLREASEAKNRFWANVSHELRTPAQLDHRAGPAADRPGGSGDLNAEQRHQVTLIEGAGTGLLGAGQRPARHGQGGIRASCRPSWPRSTCPRVLARLRALLRPMTEDRPGQPGRGRGRRTRDAAHRRGGADRDPAQPAVQRPEVHRQRRGPAQPSGRAPGTSSSWSPTPASASPPTSRSGSSRSSSRCRGPPGRHRPRPAVRPAAGRAARRAAHAWPVEPGRGTTVTLRLPHGTARLGAVLVADDDAGFRAGAARPALAGIADRVIEAADGEQALAAARGTDAGPGPDRPADAGDGRIRPAERPAVPACPAIVITSLDRQRAAAAGRGAAAQGPADQGPARDAIRRIRGAGDE